MDALDVGPCAPACEVPLQGATHSKGALERSEVGVGIRGRNRKRKRNGSVKRVMFKSEPEYYQDQGIFQPALQNGVAAENVTNGDSQQKYDGAVVRGEGGNGMDRSVEGAKEEVVVENGGVTGVQLKREATLQDIPDVQTCAVTAPVCVPDLTSSKGSCDRPGEEIVDRAAKRRGLGGVQMKTEEVVVQFNEARAGPSTNGSLEECTGVTLPMFLAEGLCVNNAVEKQPNTGSDALKTEATTVKRNGESEARTSHMAVCLAVTDANVAPESKQGVVEGAKTDRIFAPQDESEAPQQQVTQPCEVVALIDGTMRESRSDAGERKTEQENTPAVEHAPQQNVDQSGVTATEKATKEEERRPFRRRRVGRDPSTSVVAAASVEPTLSTTASQAITLSLSTAPSATNVAECGSPQPFRRRRRPRAEPSTPTKQAVCSDTPPGMPKRTSPGRRRNGRCSIMTKFCRRDQLGPRITALLLDYSRCTHIPLHTHWLQHLQRACEIHGCIIEDCMGMDNVTFLLTHGAKTLANGVVVLLTFYIPARVELSCDAEWRQLLVALRSFHLYCVQRGYVKYDAVVMTALYRLRRLGMGSLAGKLGELIRARYWGAGGEDAGAKDEDEEAVRVEVRVVRETAWLTDGQWVRLPREVAKLGMAGMSVEGVRVRDDGRGGVRLVLAYGADFGAIRVFAPDDVFYY